MGKKLGGLDAFEIFDAGWNAAVAYYAKALPEGVTVLHPKPKECTVFGGPCLNRGSCEHGSPTAGTRVGRDAEVIRLDA